MLHRCSQDSEQFERKVKACVEMGVPYLIVHGYAPGGQAPTATEARSQAETRCRTKGLDAFVGK